MTSEVANSAGRVWGGEGVLSVCLRCSGDQAAMSELLGAFAAEAMRCERGCRVEVEVAEGFDFLSSSGYDAVRSLWEAAWAAWESCDEVSGRLASVRVSGAGLGRTGRALLRLMVAAYPVDGLEVTVC